MDTSLVLLDESGPKWTVRKGESELFLKWTVARKWTVCPKVDGLLSQSGRSWVIVDGQSTKSGRSLELI